MAIESTGDSWTASAIVDVVAMPSRLRLVTWLILANFLVPIGGLAVKLTSLWLEY